jgi:hypothetical protein
VLGRCTTGPRSTILAASAARVNAGASGRLAFRPIEAFATLGWMPLTPRRRDPATRRRLPPRPTFAATPVEVTLAPGEDARHRRELDRAQVASVRESRYMIAELKRVAGVTATCVGMLVVLAILQRVAAP